MKNVEDIFRNQIEFLSSFLLSPATPIVFCEKNVNDFKKSWFKSQIWAEITKFSISPHLEIFGHLERDFPQNMQIGE